MCQRALESPIAVFTLCSLLWMGIGSAAAEDDESAAANLAVSQAECEVQPYSIELSVHDVRKTQGLITVDLHDDNPEGWINKVGRVGRVRADAQEGITRICIPVDKAGIYAIAVYHDKDSNHEFNKNFLGIPSEPYGISNDPRIGLSAPPHEKAAFDVQGPASPAKVTLRGN